MEKETNKIGILTFHSAQNYGAALQCYSTIRFLSKNGLNVETIDYKNKALIERYKKVSFKYFFNPKNIYRIFKYNSLFVNNPSFYEFQKKYLNLSVKKYDERNIIDIDSTYSSVVVGSDQVWNLSCNGDDINYFLPFYNKNKIGLSISCGGKTSLFSEDIKHLVSTFNSLSIRESDDYEIIKNTLKPDTIHAFDPVFLLTKDEWEELTDKNYNHKKDYVLVYMVFEDKSLLKYVKKQYHGTKTDVLYINAGPLKIPGVKNLRNVSPNQFLTLFLNAKAIYTNSFHGLAFSLILEKDFAVKKLSKNVSINNRIISLLESTGYSDHLIGSESYTIEYKKQNLNDHINKLQNYLLNSLNKEVRK